MNLSTRCRLLRLTTRFRFFPPVALNVRHHQPIQLRTTWIRLGSGRFVPMGGDIDTANDRIFIAGLDIEVCNDSNHLQGRITLRQLKDNLKNRAIIEHATNFCHTSDQLRGDATNNSIWYFNLEDYQTVLEKLTKNLEPYSDQIFIRPIPEFILELASKLPVNNTLPSLHDTKDALSWLPKHMNDALLPFQRQGILYGVNQCNGRIFLGDEMGLGKSIVRIFYILKMTDIISKH
jgi:hypothetical protein